MDIVNGKTYRFINVYHDGYGLNIYGTKDTDIKGGQNVCLYSASPTDQMQQWKAVAVSGASDVFQLEAVLNSVYVLDCSDGSISTSYKNNAHMCKKTGTSAVDSGIIAKPVQGVQGNQVRICLPEKNLYLTATTVTEDDTELSNNISTSAALRGGSTGRGNVYWASPASEGSMTWKKQCWEVIEVGGGTDPNPEPPTDFPTKQYLVPPFPFTGVTADFGRDCEPIAAAQDAGKKVCNAYPYNFHYGIDLIGKKKNPNNENTFVADMNIRSSGYGEVISVRTPSNPESVALGNTVLVKYPKAAYGSGSSKRDIYFLYCHLASVAVSETDKVYPGELIGVEGASGYGADYAHLHLEAYTSKIETSATESGSIGAVDPTPYLFNKEQESDDYGYGRGTIVPDCDSPFWGAAYCDGSTNGCTHDNKLYYYNLSKIRNRGDFKNPTF